MQQFQSQDWVPRLSVKGQEQDQALAELRTLLGQRLRRVFGSKPGVDESFIEDVVQDALLKILGALEQFQGKSKFTTWATTIAIRVALTEMRRMRWKDTSLDQLMESNSTGVAGLSASSRAEANVDKSQLVNAMYQIIDEELSDKQRTVLQAELQGMPLEEIGRRLGSNRNAMYKLAFDARKRLKKGLLSAGFSEIDLTSFQGDLR